MNYNNEISGVSSFEIVKRTFLFQVNHAEYFVQK